MLRKSVLALVGAALVLGAVAAAQPWAPESAEASPLRERALEHEGLIAECMETQGFEYVVAVPADVLMEEARAEAEAAGDDVAAALDELELPPDPNAGILDGLSPSEAKDYERAYWGDEEKAGCYHATYEQAWGTDILAWEEELASRLPEVEAEIAADEGIIRAREQLLDCLDGHGFRFSDLESYERFQSKETQRAIEAIGDDARPGPGGGVPADHPVWQEHVERMEEFETAGESCEREYREIVQPIENRYLQGLQESIVE